MSSPRDERLRDFRELRKRVQRRPETFGSFLGELHTFLADIYESAARADDNAEGFARALAELCRSRGIDSWGDFVTPDQRRHFIKDGTDPLAQRVIAFWAELDEPLDF